MSETSDRFVVSYLRADIDPLDFDASLAYARQRGGSGRRAAKLLGVADSTLSRWARGLTHPKPATVERIVRAVRGLRTQGPRGDDSTFVINVTTSERKRRDRDRKITGAQLQLAPGTLERAQEVWENTGSTGAAYRAFVDGIREPWYHAQFASTLPAAAGDSGSDDMRGEDHAGDDDYHDDDMRGEETAGDSDYSLYLQAA